MTRNWLAVCYNEKGILLREKSEVRWGANNKSGRADLLTFNNRDIDGRCGFTST